MDVYLLLLAISTLALYNEKVTASHNSHHGIETDVFTFRFDDDTGLYVGSNKLTCIMVSLNKDEKEQLYSTRGIERLELMMMKNWFGVLPEVVLLHTDPILSPHILHWCENRKLIMIQRKASNATTTAQTTVSKHGTETAYPSTAQTTTLQPPVTKPTTEYLDNSSTHSSDTTKTVTISSQVSSGYTSNQNNATTTSEIQPSATSSHTLKTTTPPSFGPYIIYDNTTDGQMNAVIVEKSQCYVYHLTDTDLKLVNMEPYIRDAFERALISKDRTNITNASVDISDDANQMQQTCKGGLFLLN